MNSILKEWMDSYHCRLRPSGCAIDDVLSKEGWIWLANRAREDASASSRVQVRRVAPRGCGVRTWKRIHVRVVIFSRHSRY